MDPSFAHTFNRTIDSLLYMIVHL